MPPAGDAPPRSPSSGRSTAPSRSASAPTQRRPVPARDKSGRVRRLVRPALLLVTLVLVADALVGENGWFERHREQGRLEEKTSELARLQAENDALALRVDRLERNDPAVIEDLARRKLEMLKQGELLFIEGTSGAPSDAAAAAP